MKLIDSKVEYIPQEAGLDGIYKHIEKCGRVCFKSEGKITEGSAVTFVNGLVKSLHMSVLEHGTVYLTERHLEPNRESIFKDLPYTHINKITLDKAAAAGNTMYVITTNMRVYKENGIFKMAEAFAHDGQGSYEHFVDPDEYHEKRYTFKFTCSRAIADELVRHRKFSFSMESTRYCNYSKGKFDEELTFIRPVWAKLNTGRYDIVPMKDSIYNVGDGYLIDVKRLPISGTTKEDWLVQSLLSAERHYMLPLKEFDMQPQQAREVLPLCLKTELVMTGSTEEWRHLVNVRLFEATGKVAPEMKLLMEQLKAVMEENGIWEEVHFEN